MNSNKSFICTLAWIGRIVWITELILTTIEPVQLYELHHCPDLQYWDAFLNTCEPCSVLCDKAEWTGWVEDCKDKCPGKK